MPGYADVTVRPFSSIPFRREHAQAFYALNRQWLAELYLQALRVLMGRFGLAALLALAASLATAACGNETPPTEPPGPTTGELRLIVSTTGFTLDTDGFGARVDGVNAGELLLQDTTVLADLAPGAHAVELAGVANNCAVEQGTSRTATVRADVVALVEFHVECDSALRNVILFTHGDGTGIAGLSIMQVAPDGSGLRTLFAGSHASPSPDGRQVVLMRASPAWSIYRVNADGSGQVDLTPDDDLDQVPRWSPDGNHIAFTSSRTGKSQLYLMNPDGSDQHRLSFSNRNEGSPVWSFDSRQLLLHRQAPDPFLPSELVVLQADGSGERVLIDSSQQPSGPEDWSPDGSRILYNSTSSGQNDVWVMKSDGSGKTNLTLDEGAHGTARWSPDATQIVLLNTSVGIVRIDANGGNPTILVPYPAAGAFDFVNDWIR
jgi:hypothetical protein